MRDQGLSGDAPRDESGGIGAAPGDPKGSRTPGAGAANGRRGCINIETPPLSTGPISLPGPFSFLGPLPIPPEGPLSPLGPINVAAGRIPVFPCNPSDPRPIWDQGIAGPVSGPVGSASPAPGLYTSHSPNGRLPPRKAAGPVAGTYSRLFNRVLFSVLTPIMFFLFFWAVLFGCLAVFILSRGRR